jgi:hypothetical protein
MSPATRIAILLLALIQAANFAVCACGHSCTQDAKNCRHCKHEEQDGGCCQEKNSQEEGPNCLHLGAGPDIASEAGYTPEEPNLPSRPEESTRDLTVLNSIPDLSVSEAPTCLDLGVLRL